MICQLRQLSSTTFKTHFQKLQVQVLQSPLGGLAGRLRGHKSELRRETGRTRSQPVDVTHRQSCPPTYFALCEAHLLESDILSLTEFDQILFSINDLQATLCVNQANVSRAKPAIFRKSFLCVFLVLVVALEDILATNEDFTSRVRLVGVLHGGS